MARLRQMIVAVLAVVGMLSVLPTVSAADACPMDASAPHATAMHGQQGQLPAPMNHDMQICAACVAVLPGHRLIEPRALPQAADFAGWLPPLSGIHPGLDPPPPREA